MICRLGEAVWCARVVRLANGVDPAAVAKAVRTDGRVTARLEGGDGPAEGEQGNRAVVSCREPSPLHEHVGCIRAGMGLRTRTALAAAARTRGLSTPYDDGLRDAREALAELQVEGESLAEHRRRVAETAGAVDRARVRAAELRGRLQARRESDLETGPVERELEEALAELSEAETEAIAARQRHDRARQRRRRRHAERQRRFRLEDRVGNLERRARAHLVSRLDGEYRRALSAVPGANVPERAVEADPVDAALAVARVGRLRAPVVLAVDRFDSAAAASQFLDAELLYI